MSGLEHLLRRADFLAVASKGRRWVAPGVIIQYLPHHGEAGDRSCFRYGLTASRKVGNAVVRNRARRRLRALAEEVLPSCGLPCGDLVLIARHGATVSRSFDDLRRDLLWSIRRLRSKDSSP